MVEVYGHSCFKFAFFLFKNERYLGHLFIVDCGFRVYLQRMADKLGRIEVIPESYAKRVNGRDAAAWIKRKYRNVSRLYVVSVCF